MYEVGQNADCFGAFIRVLKIEFRSRHKDIIAPPDNDGDIVVDEDALKVCSV